MSFFSSIGDAISNAVNGVVDAVTGGGKGSSAAHERNKYQALSAEVQSKTAERDRLAAELAQLRRQIAMQSSVKSITQVRDTNPAVYARFS